MHNRIRALSATAVAVSCGFVASPAALAEGSLQFDLPAQTLEQSLRAVSKTTGTNILIDRELVKDHDVPALKARLTLDEALARLLAGTGLRHRFIDERTVVLAPLSDAKAAGHTEQTSVDRSRAARFTSVMLALLSPFTVSAAQNGHTLDENGEPIETVNVFGTLDNTLSIGSKSGQSLRETPKSVTIVTRERLEEQNLTSLVDALNQTTGVTLASYSSVDSFFFSRGFRVQTMQLDGGAPAYTGDFGAFLTPDMAVYDHVEMLRGVDGMYTGAGEPGGVINLVRKRAQDTAAINLNVSAGRWNFGRVEVDATGPLTDDGRLRGRIVGAFENKDYFYDRGESDKKIGFGTLEYDLTASTLVIAGVSYERRKEDGYFIQGFPRFADGTDLNLPRTKSLAPDWSHWHLTSKEAFARVEQRYGDNGILKLNVTRLQQDSENVQYIAYGSVDPITRDGTVSYGRSSSFSSKQNLADLSANGTFELFGGEHRYTIGADYSEIDGGGQKGRRMIGYDYPGPAVDVFAPFDPSLYPRPELQTTGVYPENGQKQHGFYGTLGLQLAEPLRLTVGGRYGVYKYEQIYRSIAADGTLGAPSRSSFDDSKFIPSAALSWDFASDWSAYVSYGETFKVQANLLKAPEPGSPLDPVTGDSIEFGVKGEIGGFNTAIAIYQVQRAGQGIRDPRFPPLFDPTDGSDCCYLDQGNVTSKGVDAEISGTLLPGLQLFAGYTYNTNEYEGGLDGFYSSGGYFLNMTPKHMAKIWSTWQLPGAWSRVTINAGVIAQSENYVEGTALESVGSTNVVPFRFTQDAYSVWNASVQYRLNDVWSFGLYGDNLFDKKYYSVLGSTYTENGYGTPRSYVMTVRAKF
jgi:TonB-dependent siderophore receptor